jgi:hypothetical protein
MSRSNSDTLAIIRKNSQLQRTRRRLRQLFLQVPSKRNQKCRPNTEVHLVPGTGHSCADDQRLLFATAPVSVDCLNRLVDPPP